MRRLGVCFTLVVLVAILSGCFKKNNPASPVIENWTRANGLGNGPISSFVQVGGNLIGGVGSFGAYLYLSTDGGLNWKFLTSLPCIVTAPNVYLHPIPTVEFLVDGINLYAGVGHAWGGSISVSTDNGMTWSQKDTGFGENVNSLAMIDGTVFAGTDSGVFLSTNGGETWSPTGQGMTYQVTQLAVANGNLFAGTSFNGVFRYVANGTDWNTSQSGLAGESIYCLAAIESDLFAGAFRSITDSTNGIFVSTDDGSTWNAGNKGLPNHATISLLCPYGTQLFAGTSSGIFLSTDYGASWTNVSAGSPFDSVAIVGLAVNESNLLVGTSSGVWIGHLE